MPFLLALCTALPKPQASPHMIPRSVQEGASELGTDIQGVEHSVLVCQSALARKVWDVNRFRSLMFRQVLRCSGPLCEHTASFCRVYRMLEFRNEGVELNLRLLHLTPGFESSSGDTSESDAALPDSWLLISLHHEYCYRKNEEIAASIIKGTAVNWHDSFRLRA